MELDGRTLSVNEAQSKGEFGLEECFVDEYFHFFTGYLTTLKLEYSKFYQKVEEEEEYAADDTLVAEEDTVVCFPDALISTV